MTSIVDLVTSVRMNAEISETIKTRKLILAKYIVEIFSAAREHFIGVRRPL